MATSEIPAVRRHDGVAVIDLAGDVNRGAEATLEEAWLQATAEQPDAVVLNFEGACWPAPVRPGSTCAPTG